MIDLDIYVMSDLLYHAMYYCLSFPGTTATTLVLRFRSTTVAVKYKSAVLSRLVTFIAAYRYIRILYSWVDAFRYTAQQVIGGAMSTSLGPLTGIPHDAYRYMDRLRTVPLLLIVILPVRKLDEATYSNKAWNLGVDSAPTIALGYYGELDVTGDLTPRWMCCAFFCKWFSSCTLTSSSTDLRKPPRSRLTQLSLETSALHSFGQ